MTYPKWICGSCGVKYGKAGRLSTYHNADPEDPTDVCGWCGCKGALTQPRDFGYPAMPDKEKN